MSRLFDETDDDLRLNTRRGLAEERPRERMPERAAVEIDDRTSPDREVTLNTGTVLALFFALALVCAVFFGFGYSMGRKSSQPNTASASDSSNVTPVGNSDSSSGDNSNSANAAASTSYKPAPGSPAIQAIPGYMSQAEANEANEKAGSQSVKSSSTPAPAAPVHTAAAVATVETPKPAPVVRVAPAAPTPTYPPANTAPVAGATYVQIAAVSHQEDANVLISALQRRGYKVIARTDDADRLIHVQIGPFSARKDAEATRQKLLGDGYNAFLK